MQLRLAGLLLAACMIAGGAMAQTDDVRWVNQCVRDSGSYNVSHQVKVMYCTCMVGKMDDRETRSVTQWEQVNPAAARDCARRAGWN
jgi:hypothetical protein